jgi:hypothetical protein
LISGGVGQYYANGEGKLRSTGGNYVLDDGGTGHVVYNGGDDEWKLWAGKSTTVSGEDTPDASLSDRSGQDYSTVTDDLTFITYLMYQRAGANSIWVPLRIITWGFGATAENTQAGWIVSPGSSFIDSPDSQPASGEPTWSQYMSYIQNHPVDAVYPQGSHRPGDGIF